MTREKLTQAVAEAVEASGFAFQTGFGYRIALEIKRLPAAWLHPPTLEKKEGRNEGFIIYGVELDLVEICCTEGGNIADVKERQWAALEDKAREICRRIGEAECVQVVTDIALKPAEMSLTAKGELSLGVRFRVRMSYCECCG
ncbi:MAG: hypothetical protein FWE10_00960 [Rikenellaceae bacterium]|nr:hypothetical protein [Rikenellaceae bacterium]MCL2692306.1 hypothetical protein [Rikenellaceae bacterium]